MNHMDTRPRSRRLGADFLLAIFLVASATGCWRTEPSPPRNSSAPAPPPKLYPITMKGITLQVEAARTPEEHTVGLMYRKSLPENQGMLFIFERPQADIGFWMKNTYVPLSIAYIDPNRHITQIEDMQPLDENTHPAFAVTQYVLEVNQGWFERNGIKEGDFVDLSAMK